MLHFILTANSLPTECIEPNYYIDNLGLYLCHGGATPQCSNPEAAVGAPMCPGGNPPGAASSRLETDTKTLWPCPY